MAKKSINPLDIEFYVGAASEHAEITAEGDHEVGDLQAFLRAMWSLLTPEQKRAFAQHPEVRMTLEAVYDTEELDAALAERS